MRNYFEILTLATEMSFKGYSIFSSGGHFVQQSRNILAILVKGDKRMDGYFVYRRSTLKGHIASNKFYVI